jgi:molybdopterin synthase catalytic subunit
MDGAVALFLGTVRDHNDGRDVDGLEYEAYGPMAERVLAEIAAEAASRWQTDRIAAAHRFGLLAIGEASVAIAVSTPHRADAFDACRYIIEQIKERLPIWKRESYGDGTSEWVDGRVLTGGGGV